MPTGQVTPSRDCEEALRSIGRLFDEQRLEDVLVMERRAVFQVTGLPSAPGLTFDPEHRYEYVASDHPDDVVVASM